MANPTTNFGWQMPQNTDLVKDLPADFEVFGQAVDTDLADLKGGTTGQILSKTSNTDLDFTWINNDQGDITEVQGGTGISVASGTGPVPVITNTVATEFDAKADLIVGTGADTFDRLGVGADGTVLTADSNETLGVKWAAAGSAFSGARLTNSTTYTISTATDTLLGFDTETFDTDSYHSTVTNTSRLTAPSTGYYFFEAQINWDYGATAANNPIMRVKKNGSIYQVVNDAGTSQRSRYMNTSGVVQLNSGEYIEIEVRQDSGGNVTIINGNACTNFTIYSLGA